MLGVVEQMEFLIRLSKTFWISDVRIIKLFNIIKTGKTD